jgi:glycosyltransferase involved in cell wall biosynthesis
LNWENTPKIRLLVIGRGDLYEQLLKLKENGLEHRLILIDWQPYEKVPEFVAAADICLLPAYNNEIMRDIVPIKMYEYTACGKPIIATKLLGILKEFGEDNNVVYVNRPEEVLSKAIELSKDTENKKRIKLKASQFGLDHSWKNITDQFETTLKQLSKS